MKQAAGDSDDDDELDTMNDESVKSTVNTMKKKSGEIPLILAPSQQETESNPWLTTNGSAVLPASEYSKPMEVRNSDQSSSSSESEDDENAEEEAPQDEPTLETKTSDGVANQKQEHLTMPKANKSLAKETDSKPNETNKQHHMNIQEAFADDDVLAEFEKEKVSN